MSKEDKKSSSLLSGLVKEFTNIMGLLSAIKRVIGVVGANEDAFSFKLLSGARGAPLDYSRPIGIKNVVHIAILFSIIVIYFTSHTLAQNSRDASMSRPAEYIGELSISGNSNQILRPSAIFVDRNFDEIFVCDPGSNRIVIFDRDENFRFEFSGGGYFSMPVAVAVDSKGYIWVLGSTKNGREMFVFDFDGTYLRKFPLSGDSDHATVQAGNFVLDASDNIYFLDHASAKIISLDASGSIRHSFDVYRNRKDIEVWELVLGDISIDGDRLFVPSGFLGRVKVYNLKGDLLWSLGRKGTQIGQLNFPVAVAVSRDGIIMILDKHRFNVVCFAPDRRFLGEFGGKGVNPGWFYHPTLLAVDQQDRAIIGQIFNNKIQLCRIPEFIIAEIGLVTPNQSDSIGIIETERIRDAQSTIIKEVTGEENDLTPPLIITGGINILTED